MNNEQKEIIRQAIEECLKKEDRILPSHYSTSKQYRRQLVEEAGLLEFIIEDVQPQNSPDDIDAFLAEITNTIKVPVEQECDECFGLGVYDVQFNFGAMEYTCERCEGSGLKKLSDKQQGESI